MISPSNVFQRRIYGGNESTDGQNFSAAAEFSLFRGFGGFWAPLSFRGGENFQESGRHILFPLLSIGCSFRGNEIRRFFKSNSKNSFLMKKFSASPKEIPTGVAHFREFLEGPSSK